MPQTHELKSWPDQFQAMWIGQKRAEFRRDDRGYELSDLLELREWDPAPDRYTGFWMRARVTYLVRGPRLVGRGPRREGGSRVRGPDSHGGARRGMARAEALRQQSGVEGRGRLRESFKTLLDALNRSDEASRATLCS